MSVDNANIKIQQVLTKEQIAYDEAIKNMKYITAELRLSQEGIDIITIPYDKLETIVSLFDEMDAVQREFNVEMQKFQLDTNNKAKILQEEANKKFGDVQNRYRELVESMKKCTVSTVINDEYNVQNVTLSKEREEQIKKELADALARSKEIDKNNL